MAHDVYAYGFTIYQNKHVQSTFPKEPICVSHTNGCCLRGLHLANLLYNAFVISICPHTDKQHSRPGKRNYLYRQTNGMT